MDYSGIVSTSSGAQAKEAEKGTYFTTFPLVWGLMVIQCIICRVCH